MKKRASGGVPRVFDDYRRLQRQFRFLTAAYRVSTNTSRVIARIFRNYLDQLRVSSGAKIKNETYERRSVSYTT
ncbi:MAG TPA: hypothetical protein VJ180_11500 [Pyrinomonadaceae bacterium]|nr:hypothetical protein [Pyrinomonadaceae bacterium]